jgi:hypothetical protein
MSEKQVKKNLAHFDGGREGRRKSSRKGQKKKNIPPMYHQLNQSGRGRWKNE